jgi:alanyl-tRNA synthetase
MPTSTCACVRVRVWVRVCVWVWVRVGVRGWVGVSGTPGLRVVRMAGLGCPCGGTHVPQLGDLGHVTIARIKTTPKRGTTTVAYTLGPAAPA